MKNVDYASVFEDRIYLQISSGANLVSVCLFPSPQKPAPPSPPPDWSKEPGKVHFPTNETWDKFIEEHSSVLVMLFSPRK